MVIPGNDWILVTYDLGVYYFDPSPFAYLSVYLLTAEYSFIGLW